MAKIRNGLKKSNSRDGTTRAILPEEFSLVVVHGDAAGAETLRRMLTDWLTDMGLMAAGNAALVDGYVGYYKPYATSHDDLDQDKGFQNETRNAARSLISAVRLLRRGRLKQPDASLPEPRPK